MRPTRAFPLAVLACACAAAGASVTDQMIQTEARSGRNVLSWGLSTDGQRYSPLKQVNMNTVSRLTPAWAFSFGGEKQRGQESQPLIYNGKMFVTASYSRLFAL
ncbi:MAG TPA: PQQ-dependent dehydrogenase, methanol/ethanol family, partial [Ideonella sp.]|nr:PQQ-dependent dehydrogenase, methanol/ethanol family [Ideonella sp.]